MPEDIGNRNPQVEGNDQGNTCLLGLFLRTSEGERRMRKGRKKKNVGEWGFPYKADKKMGRRKPPSSNIMKKAGK